ncbi:hypothetical protein ABPG74_000711 [Tetrahymena malaccensis]
MEDSIYESLSFRQEQQKIKERLSFQMQNMQKNYSIEDSMLTKNLDYSITSQITHRKQDQGAILEQNNSQALVKSINLIQQNEQNPKDMTRLQDNNDNNEIYLMSPFYFSSNVSKDITPCNLIAEKNDQNSLILRKSQYSLQPKQFDDSTKNQFFTPNNKNKRNFDYNNRFLSEIYQQSDQNNLQNQDQSSKNQIISSNYSKNQQLKTKFVINKFVDVKKFVNKLKEKSRGLLFKSISSFQFNLINDVSSDLDFYLENKCINLTKRSIGISSLVYFNNQIFGKSFQEFLDGKYLFSLDNLLMQMWDIFIMLFTIIVILTIPIMHLLASQEIKFLIAFHDHIIVWVLIIEVMLSLNTEIYENGISIRDRRQIFKQNFNNLMQDFLILIIYCFSTSSYNQKIRFLQYLDYIVFLKYLNIPQKVSEFENKLQISHSAKNWMKLIKLEILVITLAHVACCNFLKIGLENSKQQQISWITKTGFGNDSLWDLYLLSLYYMIITICTIGYGDIYPYQLNEKLYIAFVAILATNVTAYAFSQISEIVEFESSKNQKFNDFMTNINNQMKKIGLGTSLQVKVRKHFEFVYYQDENKQQISESIVDKLPSSLKNEVLLDIYQEKINSIKMFKEFSPDCLKNLLLSFKQKQLYPDEILVNQQENSENLYFLISGNLEINFQIRETKSGKTYEKSKQKIQVILNNFNIIQKLFQLFQKSDAFGYEGFLLGKSSPYTLKSIGSSLISQIDRNLFLNILKQYPEDYEKFMFMRDSSIFGQKNEFFKFQECISCGKFSHQISDCPHLSLNLTYKPSKEKNERVQSILRKRQRFKNTLKNMIHIQEKAMAAQANNDESAIIDAYNICLKPISESDDKQSDSQSELSSLSLNNSKNNNKGKSSEIQSNKQSSEKQMIPFYSLSSKLPQKTNLQNQEQENISKALSLKIDENSQSDKVEFKVNQNTLLYDQDKDKYSELYQKSKETTILNEESCGYRNSNKSIILTEEAFKDKMSNYDKLNQEKINGVFNLGSSSEQYSSQQSGGGQLKIQKINTLYIESSQNYFETPEIYLLKQAFQKRKMRSVQLFNNFQRSLSDTSKSFNFCQNKQNQLLLDILMNLRDSKLKSQQTQLKNPQNKEYLNSIIEQLLLIHKSRTENKLINLNQQQNQQLLKESSKQAEEFNQQIENFSEFSIRQKIGLQDLDMLVVRKQFILQQQQNKIQNFILVPDNEIDIDKLSNFKYYYENYNYKYVLNRYKNYQQKNQILQQFKHKKLINPKKFKKQKLKNINSSKQDY